LVPAGLESLAFVPIRRGEQRFWQPPTDFSFLATVAAVPLAHTELLQTAHHLPILVSVAGATRAVAATRSDLLRQPLVHESGRWMRAYTPLALRALPFGLDVPPSGEVEKGRFTMAESIGVAGPQDGFPLFDEGGGLSRQAAEVSATLTRTYPSTVQLGAAADLLILADLLTPLDVPNDDTGSQMLTVDGRKLAALSAHRASVLARDGYLALHLLYAMAFSRRFLAPEVTTSSGEDLEDAPDPTFGFQPTFFAPMHFALDDSELVPVNWFE
jgi:hypothetical protein